MKYVDPWGFEVWLGANRTYALIFQSIIQAITDDKVTISLQYNKAGEKEYKMHVQSISKDDNYKVKGTALIKALVSSKYEIDVGFMSENDLYGATGVFIPDNANSQMGANGPGTGSGGEAKLNKEYVMAYLSGGDYTTGSYIMDNGRIVEEKMMSIYVAMAHELIHAFHAINGEMIPNKNLGRYMAGGYTYSERLEEILTTGLDSPNSSGYGIGDITEQDIRDELKIPKRAIY